MLGQATSILTSTVGAGMVTAHKKSLQNERINSGAGESGITEISNDAYIASITIILSGVNSFLYQLVLLPLYTLIAFQKTVVCTTNDIFGIFDSSGLAIRVGREDMQRASDVSSGVCLSAMMESAANDAGQSDAQDTLADSGSDLLKNVGNSALSILASGSVGRSYCCSWSELSHSFSNLLQCTASDV
jgi:hypothetical protein